MSWSVKPHISYQSVQWRLTAVLSNVHVDKITVRKAKVQVFFFKVLLKLVYDV